MDAVILRFYSSWEIIYNPTNWLKFGRVKSYLSYIAANSNVVLFVMMMTDLKLR